MTPKTPNGLATFFDWGLFPAVLFPVRKSEFCDLYKTDMPQEMQDKQKAKAVNQALKLLISEGVIPPESISTTV